MTTQETIHRCKAALEGHYGSQFRGMVLYGSLARGQADPASDIDLLVLLGKPFDYFKELREIVDLLYPVQLDTDRLISVKPAPVDEFESGSLQLYRNAMREGNGFDVRARDAEVKMSLNERFALAVLLAVLTCFVQGLVAGEVLILLVVAVLVFLSVGTLRDAQPGVKSSAIRALAGIGLAFIGTAGSVVCYYSHICMGGHMAHPPYAWWHFALDIGWLLTLVGSFFYLLRIRSRAAIVIAALSTYLLIFRFLCGSYGGMYILPL